MWDKLRLLKSRLSLAQPSPQIVTPHPPNPSSTPFQPQPRPTSSIVARPSNLNSPPRFVPYSQCLALKPWTFPPTIPKFRPSSHLHHCLTTHPYFHHYTQSPQHLPLRLLFSFHTPQPLFFLTTHTIFPLKPIHNNRSLIAIPNQSTQPTSLPPSFPH